MAKLEFCGKVNVYEFRNLHIQEPLSPGCKDLELSREMRLIAIAIQSLHLHGNGPFLTNHWAIASHTFSISFGTTQCKVDVTFDIRNTE
jgi:hypothetical protein